MNDEITAYPIPDNFIKSGTILNGMVKLRNAIEAVIFGFLIGFPLFKIEYSSISTKIAVIVTIVLPVMLICIKGINGDTVTVFLGYLYKWFKKKRIMLYDNKLHTQVASPTQLMMARELPKDRIVSVLKKWKDTQRNKNNNIEFVEGKTFDFVEDKEYTLFEAEAEKFKEKKMELDTSFENEDTLRLEGTAPLTIEKQQTDDDIDITLEEDVSSQFTQSDIETIDLEYSDIQDELILEVDELDEVIIENFD